MIVQVRSHLATHHMKALNQETKNTNRSDLHIAHPEDLSQKTLCLVEDRGYPSKACVDRLCENCGEKDLEKWYAPLMNNNPVRVHQWKVVEELKFVKVKGEKNPQLKKVKALKLVTETMPCSELVTKLVSDMKLFSGHLFRARWQADQFRKSKEKMPGKSAVLVADYAENYTCGQQNEAQSYHWNQSQVTIHPIMAYVNDSSSPQEPTHTEAIYCITDDPKHDAAAVHTFLNIAYKFLKEKYSICSIVLWTDCCACQIGGKQVWPTSPSPSKRVT